MSKNHGDELIKVLIFAIDNGYYDEHREISAELLLQIISQLITKEESNQ